MLVMPHISELEIGAPPSVPKTAVRQKVDYPNILPGIQKANGSSG